MTTPLSASASEPQRRKALLAVAAAVVLALLAGVIWHMRRAASPTSGAPARQSPASAATSPRAGPARAPAPAPGVSEAIGRLVIHTRPEGAQLYLNGRATPYRSPVNISLAPGNYRVTVELSGFTRETKYVVVGKDQTEEVQFKLQRTGRGPFRR